MRCGVLLPKLDFFYEICKLKKISIFDLRVEKQIKHGIKNFQMFHSYAICKSFAFILFIAIRHEASLLMMGINTMRQAKREFH